ncbi:ATP-binding protein [Pseudoduganella namucuonensis]|uniref:Virulence sensor protein BvgS n=1 Tax=Pseudoduganella namucuonensis TaxID=1035707 RepID=A0A1I7M7C6_9BURK|nr:ATP-binding protein [Pseudoduganella namucuonensis]SFV17849.1 PAS domain S-box-containing protein [Pseudoduganella namucuonensis]
MGERRSPGALAGPRGGAWLLAAGCCWLAAAGAQPPQPPQLQQWREELSRAHVLVERDAPAAHALARRLRAAPADASGADRTRALNLLARTELMLAHSDAASALAERALEQARQQGDRVGQAEADMVLALSTVAQGRIDRLVSATTHAVKILDGVARPELLSEAMLRAAMTYSRLGKLDDSVAICVQAMEIARVSALPRALAFGHQCMAISFAQSDNGAEAMRHYVAMADAARADGSKILLALALSGQGGLLGTSGDLRGGEALIRQAVQLFREVGGPYYLNSCLHGLATNLSKQGRHTEALRLFDDVAGMYQRYANRIGLWWSLTARGAEHAQLGNPDAAWRDVEQSYRLAKEVGVELYVGNSARQLAALAARRGNHQLAYAYSLEAAELAAKAARDKTSARVIELTERYESESKQRHIDTLTRSNASQQAELERRALQQRWLWTVLGGSLALLACIAVFMARLRRSHRLVERLNAELEETVQQRTGALRQQTRYLRVLIDTLPCWVWFKDTDSRYLAVNRAVADTWSRDVDAMVGLADDDITPGLAALFRQEDQEVMATRQARTVEAPLATEHGVVWVETFKAAVVDDDGSVLGTVGFARDVSERKQAEAAREAALLEAQRLASLRSEFLAQMSHELRTPLNGILGYAQLLRRDPGLSEQQRAGVAVIHDSGDHLLTLINDLLDSAKIEANKLEPQLGAVPLRQCLQTLADMVKVRAEQKALAFHCDIDAAVPAVVLADEQRLRQALLNLLANAVKFTDRGGVTLRVQALDGERLRFEVADTGVGIEAGQLERIFLPFEQAGDAQRRQGGTGLGLAISRQFVRLLGGEIAVESQPGQGCRFWFELALPVLEAPAPEPAAPRWIVGYHGPRRRVLVADDQPENRRLLSDMLAPLGFEVEQAAHGRAVLDLAARRRPDLILMDVAMPGMDGLEAVRRLRGDDALRGLPVIAVSASAGAGDRQRQRDAGFDDSLSKPVNLDQLLAQVGRLLALEWRRQASPADAPRDEDDGAPLVAPPPDEMAVLHHLAQVGNMRNIIERADHLIRLDRRYRPFAGQLRRLAKGYQSQALLQLVERHLDRQAGVHHDHVA